MDSIDNTITNILEPTRNRGDVNYLDLSEEESYNLDVNEIISDSIIREVEQRVEEANNQAVDITNELIGSEFFIKNVSLIEFCEHVSDVFDLIDTEIPLRGQALLLDKTTYSSDSQGRVIICDPRMILPIGKSEFNTTIRTKCSVSDKLINKGFFIKITNADGGMICFVSFKSDEKNYVLYKIIDGTYFFYGIGSVGISCPIPNYIDPENMILNGLIKMIY